MRQRGRMKIREQLEKQTGLVILNPKDYRGRWSGYFGNDHPIYVELGMGKGKFISEMSVRYPEINFIGIDMFDSLIRTAGDKARSSGNTLEPPPNLALVLFNIQLIEEIFAPREVSRIFLNFSDPWPKERHARRRLTHVLFVQKYREILAVSGEIHLKTDSRPLFEYSLGTFQTLGLQVSEITYDLHGSGSTADNIMTEYESKFVHRGLPIFRCEITESSAE